MTLRTAGILILGYMLAMDGHANVGEEANHSITSATYSQRFFMPNKDCLNATVEIRLEDGTAYLVVKKIGPIESNNQSGGGIANKNLMEMKFGNDACRISVTVAPVK